MVSDSGFIVRLEGPEGLLLRSLGSQGAPKET